jgi:Fe-S-cluster containining protein
MYQASLEDIINDYQHGVYDFTKDGKCIGCGNCCSNLLPLTNKEIREIKKYIEKHNIKKQDHRLFVLAKNQIDMMCPFLDDSKPKHKCTIYEVRPFICQDFICSREKQPDSRLYQGGRHTVDVAETFFSPLGSE